MLGQEGVTQRFTDTPFSQMLHHWNASSWPVKNNSHLFSFIFDHELFPWKENLVVLGCLVCLGSLPSPRCIWAPLIVLLLLGQTVFWGRHVTITTKVTFVLWQNQSLSLNNSGSKTQLHGWMQYFFSARSLFTSKHTSNLASMQLWQAKAAKKQKYKN